jgi:ABC-type antimicrobial peptide transport system permease subunit
MLGGVIGLLIAIWGADVLLKLSPIEIPRLNHLSVNAPILAFTLGVSLLTGLIFGVFPALQASKPDLNLTLKEGGRDSQTGGGRIRNAL